MTVPIRQCDYCRIVNGAGGRGRKATSNAGNGRARYPSPDRVRLRSKETGSRPNATNTPRLLYAGRGRVRLSRLPVEAPELSLRSRSRKSDGGFEGVATGVALPKMADASTVEIFRPFGDIEGFAALRAFDHGAGAREPSAIGAVVKFHEGDSLNCRCCCWPPDPGSRRC